MNLTIRTDSTVNIESAGFGRYVDVSLEISKDTAEYIVHDILGNMSDFEKESLIEYINN